MASIYKRKSKDGKTLHWRAVVRLKGHPTVCETFDRKQAADDWAREVERQIKAGQYQFNQFRQKYTFNDLVGRFISDGMLEHHKSSNDTRRHLDYWKSRFGAYALVYITPEFISKERQLLLETPTSKGEKRSPATVNRYVAALSSIFTYAFRQLRWVSENPCLCLVKLKESAGRDRVLSIGEARTLLENCKSSKCPYLYAIVLMALTTGMRQGEILALKWKDIDFENNLIHIRDSKNGKPRASAVVASLKEELFRLFEIRETAKEFIFASKTAFGNIDITKPFKLALEQSNIENFVFHSCRHTFATMAARQGASNLELATATGHKTLQMLQRYTHLDVRTTKKFSNNISDQILGTTDD